ncbi:MAG: hypothetical protein R2879_21695 [Saprospiraceae bacterium]
MRVLNLTYLLLLFFSVSVSAQDRPFIYFGQTTYGAGVVANMIGRGIPATADFNNDGVADVGLPLLQNFIIATSVYRNGEFGFEIQPNSYFQDGNIYLRIQFEDLTDDGYKELSMQRYDSNNAFEPYLFKNNMGIFEDARMPVPSVFPKDTPLQFGHFNNDGIPDAAYRDGNLFIINGADGTIHEMPFTYGRLFFMDFNHDGLIDIINSQYYSDVHSAYGDLLLLSKGDFTFDEYLTIDNRNVDGFGDFDGDGVEDIIDWDRGMAFNLKLNLKSQNQATNINWIVNQENQDRSLAVYDLNEDGLDDVILFGRDSTYYCQTQPDLSFKIFSTVFGKGGQKFFTRDESWPLGTLVGQDGTGGLIYYHLSFENNNFQVEDRSARVIPPQVNSIPYRFDLLAMDRDKIKTNSKNFGSIQVKISNWRVERSQFDHYSYFFPDVSLISSVTIKH